MKKERILEEITIRQRQIKQIQREIDDLIKKLNEKHNSS